MSKLNNKEFRNLVNKTYGVVQTIFGLGIPVQIGILQFSTYTKQRAKTKMRRSTKCAYCATYDQQLLMRAKLLPKAASGKFTVGKVSLSKEDVDKMIGC